MAAEPKKLLTFEFVSLCFVMFFAFCNMAVFYSFFNYLERIGIPAEWRGFLVGLEPMSAFMLRLAVIPMLHIGNAVGVMAAALVMLAAALCSYAWATTIPTLIFLRIFHGAAFVLLVSASMALVVHFIPKERSGQGFGFVSVAVLVPYAVMPLATEALLRYTENEAHIYRGITVMAVPAFVLLFILRKRLRSVPDVLSGALARRPAMKEIRQNLGDSSVVFLLAVNFFIYLCYASVFYFIKSCALKNGIANVGSFFTISILVMIALRLLGGVFFDKIDKVKTLQVFMFLLIPCFVLLSRMHSDRMLYLTAGYYGLCIGIILPLINAAMFVVSPPHLRGLNTNLALFMMDGAFFLSPYAGGTLIALGGSFGLLFNVCAGFLLLNVIFLILLKRQRNRVRTETLAE